MMNPEQQEDGANTMSTEVTPVKEETEGAAANGEDDGGVNDDSGGVVRRSGRKRVSTIVKIGGHYVKKENNYVVKGGTYVHEAFEGEEATTNKKPKIVAPKKQTAASTVRKQSPAEVARLKNNEAIKASIQKKEAFRREFLVQHMEVLEPFMDEPTRRMLQQWSDSKPSGATTYRKEELYSQPDLITGGELRDYQLVGLNFMLNLYKQNIGSILGDEMGLGKTLQTISLLCQLKKLHEHCGPSLIVCPLSVLYSWCSELEKWAPSLKVLRLHASNAEDQAQQRRELADQGCQYDVIVTTYDMVKVPQLMNMWSRLYFRIVCLDEGHKIKNSETQIAQACRKIHCENRLILTGTPLQNNLVELVSLLNFLLPDIFNNFKPFQDAFDITNNNIDKEKMLQAQKVLEVFMIRRLKATVEKLMPEKIETKVYCPLSRTQVFWYKALLMKDLSLLAKQDGVPGEATGGVTSTNKLAGLIMQLRKACIHPFLFDGAETNIGETTIKQLIAASGKLAVLDSLLRSLFQKGHRVVLFSQFTSVLDILADYCSMRGWEFVAFDGRTSRATRNYLVNAFNAPNSPYFIFLMSTRSGSMGLNLQTADTCILMDSDPNPQMDLQAQARVHRIGQKKTVHVYRLISSGTIEERIIERADKKLLLDKMVNRDRASGDKDDGEEAGMSASQMMKDIKFGCAAVFGDSSLNVLPSEKDIQFITDRKRTEMDSGGKLKGNVSHKAEDFDATKKLTETQVFHGVDFKKLRDDQEKKQRDAMPSSLKGIGRLWMEISDLGDKRKAKSRIVMVAGKGSGYGSSAVPVLASNNYDLENGEGSVFGRELSSGFKGNCAVLKKKGKTKVPENQSHCQVCGGGGLLYLCSRCPVSAHRRCCATIDRMQPACSHHWCSLCSKPAQHAGGLLYRCQSCPNAYCEDCLPSQEEGFRILGACERFEELGFDSTRGAVYVHCNTHCENYAIQNFTWKPKSDRRICPEEINCSDNFGGSTDEGRSQAPAVASAPKGLTSVPAVPLAASTSGSSSECSSSSGEAVDMVDLTGE